MGNSNDKHSQNEKLSKENEQLKQQLRDLTQRLSHEMGKKVGANESSIENINIKNRPMNISDEYSKLGSDVWLEAKTEIDETIKKTDQTEKDSWQLLCDILMVAEDCSTKAVATLANRLGQQLNDPQLIADLCNEASTSNPKKQNPKSAPKELSALQPKKTNYTLDDLTPEQQDTLRCLADSKDIEPLSQDIKNQLDKKYPEKKSVWQKVKTGNHVKTYIHTTARLTWKMVVQRPPMEFKKNKPVNYLGKEYQDLHWGSAECYKENAEVIELYPMLYHGETLMNKGKVFISQKLAKGKK